jgi:hypothetical protein
MENRYSWQKMAVALFDRATARLGEDARQLQDAMFWLRGDEAEPAESAAATWALATQGDSVQR